MLFSQLHNQTWLESHCWLSSSQLCFWALRTSRQGKSPNPLPDVPIASCGSVPWASNYIYGTSVYIYYLKYYTSQAPQHRLPTYPPKLGCHIFALQGMLQPDLISIQRKYQKVFQALLTSYAKFIILLR